MASGPQLCVATLRRDLPEDFASVVLVSSSSQLPFHLSWPEPGAINSEYKNSLVMSLLNLTGQTCVACVLSVLTFQLPRKTPLSLSHQRLCQLKVLDIPTNVSCKSFPRTPWCAVRAVTLAPHSPGTGPVRNSTVRSIPGRKAYLPYAVHL